MIRIPKQSLWNWLYRFNARWSIVHSYQPSHTNLCHFMRCIFVWLPLKFITPALLLAAGIVWWEIALSVIAGIFAVTTIICGLGLLAAWISNRIDRPHEPNLVWQYIKAKKRKICPFVEVE